MYERPLVILRYVPGVDAEDVLPGMDDSRRASIFSDFGDAIRRLHTVALPKFTNRIGTPEADVNDWTTVVSQKAEDAASLNHKIGVLTASDVADIHDRLINAAADVSEVVSPTLIHHDLYMANVLINDGRFAALLDFGQAKAWDPMFDFVKLGMWVFERWPESLAPFMSGYCRSVDRLPRAEERLVVSLTLENLVSLPYWLNRGDDRLAKNSMDLLRGCLSGSFPWWVGQVGAELGRG